MLCPAELTALHEIIYYACQRSSFGEPPEARLVWVDTLLARGLAAMSVDAADDAFRDFSLDRVPGETTGDHVRDLVILLPGNVIELEYDRIDLATHDAGVLPQIRVHTNPVDAGALCTHGLDVRDVPLTILCIPLALVPRHALATPRLQLMGRLVAQLEMGEGSFKAAALTHFRVHEITTEVAHRASRTA